MSLQKMLDMQETAQKLRGYNFQAMTTKEIAAYIKAHAQYMTVELGEFLNEIPFFKDWKVYDAEGIKNAKATEELSDVLHFFLNICLAYGMNEEMIYKMYTAKHDINKARLTDTTKYKADTAE